MRPADAVFACYSAAEVCAALHARNALAASVCCNNMVSSLALHEIAIHTASLDFLDNVYRTQLGWSPELSNGWRWLFGAPGQ